VKFDEDKDEELNKSEFMNLVDFLIEKYNTYKGNTAAAEASV